MVAANIPQLGVIGRNPDFVALAQACGAEGYRVHDPGALTEALRTALSQAGPTLIEVVASSFEKHG
jgi:pyruvate dehydrogenase (quinone)